MGKIKETGLHSRRRPLGSEPSTHHQSRLSEIDLGAYQNGWWWFTSRLNHPLSGAPKKAPKTTSHPSFSWGKIPGFFRLSKDPRLDLCVVLGVGLLSWSAVQLARFYATSRGRTCGLPELKQVKSKTGTLKESRATHVERGETKKRKTEPAHVRFSEPLAWFFAHCEGRCGWISGCHSTYTLISTNRGNRLPFATVSRCGVVWCHYDL